MITKTFTKYVDLVNKIHRRGTTPGSNEFELQDLSNDIKDFMGDVRSTFARYQASSMGTSKFHLLNHVVEDIRATGGIEYLSSSLYEKSHKSFKEDHARTSRRIATVMEETLRKGEHRSLRSNDCKHKARKKEISIKASRENGAYFVKTGKLTSIDELTKACAVGYHKRKRRKYDPQTHVKKHIIDLASDVGDEAVKKLIRLLFEELYARGLSEDEAFSTKLLLPAFAYLSAHAPPTLDAVVKVSSVIMKSGTLEEMQSVVAYPNFYNLKSGMYDSVMIESNEQGGYDEYMMQVWFGRALAFIHTRGNDEDGYVCRHRQCNGCQICNIQRSNELCFIQYYQVLEDNHLKIDAIDRALECVQLRWDRTEGKPGELAAAKQFGLVPVGSLCGCFQPVRIYFHLPLLAESVKRRKRYDELQKGEKGWSSHLFAIYRFYRRYAERFTAEIEYELR